ncbi:hypothetical protein LSUCC0031_01525 [Rhodobacterales bacterium LSUCC0031]|nr:hypothetical protein [Rhodobacterales bacterium LSUCC0031]
MDDLLNGFAALTDRISRPRQNLPETGQEGAFLSAFSIADFRGGQALLTDPADPDVVIAAMQHSMSPRAGMMGFPVLPIVDLDRDRGPEVPPLQETRIEVAQDASTPIAFQVALTEHPTDAPPTPAATMATFGPASSAPQDDAAPFPILPTPVPVRIGVGALSPAAMTQTALARGTDAVATITAPLQLTPSQHPARGSSPPVVSSAPVPRPDLPLAQKPSQYAHGQVAVEGSQAHTRLARPALPLDKAPHLAMPHGQDRGPQHLGERPLHAIVPFGDDTAKSGKNAVLDPKKTAPGAIPPRMPPTSAKAIPPALPFVAHLDPAMHGEGKHVASRALPVPVATAASGAIAPALQGVIDKQGAAVVVSAPTKTGLGAGQPPLTAAAADLHAISAMPPAGQTNAALPVVTAHSAMMPPVLPIPPMPDTSGGAAVILSNDPRATSAIPLLMTPESGGRAPILSLAQTPNAASRASAPGESAVSPSDLGHITLGLTSGSATPTDLRFGARAPDLPLLAQAATQQIALGAAQLQAEPGAPVDIALDPPELGRVRLSIVEVNGALSVSIMAERPETADLMRRHLSLLADEFARQGLDAPSVDISSGGQGRQQTRDDDMSGAGKPPDHPISPGQGQAAAHMPQVAPSGLDLRL